MNKILRNILALLFLVSTIIYFILLHTPQLPIISNEDIQAESVEDISANKDKTVYQVFRLSSHFPNEFVSTPVSPKEEIVETPVYRGPVLSSEWKFISTIIRSNIKNYYFKNTRSGQILSLHLNEEIDNWTLLTINFDSFILQNGDNKYKVLKQ